MRRVLAGAVLLVTLAGCGDSRKFPVDQKALASAVQHDVEASETAGAQPGATLGPDVLDADGKTFCRLMDKLQTTLGLPNQNDDAVPTEQREAAAAQAASTDPAIHDFSSPNSPVTLAAADPLQLNAIVGDAEEVCSSEGWVPGD